MTFFAEVKYTIEWRRFWAFCKTDTFCHLFFVIFLTHAIWNIFSNFAHVGVIWLISTFYHSVRGSLVCSWNIKLPNSMENTDEGDRIKLTCLMESFNCPSINIKCILLSFSLFMSRPFTPSYFSGKDMHVGVNIIELRIREWNWWNSIFWWNIWQ